MVAFRRREPWTVLVFSGGAGRDSVFVADWERAVLTTEVMVGGDDDGSGGEVVPVVVNVVQLVEVVCCKGCGLVKPTRRLLTMELGGDMARGIVMVVAEGNSELSIVCRVSTNLYDEVYIKGRKIQLN